MIAVAKSAARSQATESALTESPLPPPHAYADDDINPFQVYPVRALNDIQDVQAVTVRTPEVLDVDRAVRDFVENLDLASDPPAKLLLAAKGDFGTGKTHLMLYARGLLVSEMARLHPVDPKKPGPSRAPITTMTISTEAPIEEWFASELGPNLIETASPRELVRELLTQCACDVAAADSDPDIAALADQFRASRKAVYEIFRNPGEFDVSEVEARFTAEIVAACPRTSLSFRRAIEALRWEETAEIAEDWLAGNELSPSDVARIGVRSEGDRAVRGANAVCAIASLSRRLGRPFALFLDEFEHLARYDMRHLSKRNITWTKRLVESLARRGAMVFISGHWEAWAQQGDFLDRFVGGRPIQLVRLNAEDVMKVVHVRAGEWPGFTIKAAEAVVEETSGNIRRVMTVLFDLWNGKAAPTSVIDADAVRLAAQRRLQPGSEIGIMPAIEAASRANGAVFSRDELFGSSGRRVGVARVGTDVRLLVGIVHARDELALVSNGEAFARLVKEVRASYPRARGLCVTLGAVIAKHVHTLDAAFPETDLVNGEEPGLVEQLPQIVAHALATDLPQPAAPAPASLQALDQTRLEIVDRAESQIARSQEVFGTDSRSAAVRQTAVADTMELAGQKATLARDRIFESTMRDAQQSSRNILFSALLGSPFVVVTLAAGVGLLAADFWLSDVTHEVFGGTILSYRLANLAMSLLPLLFLLLGSIAGAMIYMDIAEFNRFRLSTLRFLYEDGAPVGALVAANDGIQRCLQEDGPRKGRLSAMHLIQEMTGSRPVAPAP